MQYGEDNLVEPVLKLLAAAMVFFTTMLFLSEVFFKDDPQFFQVISSVLTGIVGAFLARIKPAKGDSGTPGPTGAAGAPGVAVAEVTVSQPPKGQ